jgi:FkbM family methyltransferase
MHRMILKTTAWFARQLPASWKTGIYRIKPLANGIRYLLNRSSPDGLTRMRVAGGDLIDTKLYLNLQTEKDYWLGTYEPELQKAIRHWVQPGMVVYDVGANIGYISLLMAKAVGRQGKVYSFEALPVNIERLKQNILSSNTEVPITVIHAAVTDKDQPVEFLVHESTSMGKVTGAAGREVAYENRITVDGITLDTYQSGNNISAPDIIKMDIEGGEVLAVEGMRRLLQEHHPILFIELHGPESAKAVAKVLDDYGYTAYHMKADHKVINLHHPDHWKAYIIAR